LQYFRDQGHEVSIVSFTPGTFDFGIDLHYLQHPWPIHHERANWHYLLQLPRLWRTVNRIDPQLLNAHFLSSYGFLGALIRPADRPYVVSLHGSDILRFPQRSLIHRWITKFALARADLVTSVAEHMTKALHQYLSRDKEILTLQYGVDTSLFRPPDPYQARQPVCLSTRKMVPLANLEDVILSAKWLKRLESPIHLSLANNGPLFNMLTEKVKQLDLCDRVSFLNRVSQFDMANLLRTASLYISLTGSDGASLSLMEAMACGAFPIVADIPANREWINDGFNGYLVPAGSPQLVARRLDEAWRQRDLRRKAARLNWALIQEKGDYWKNMSVIESTYECLAQPTDR
jgi:glycosyltransferase involved in cell wall biosynthesis